MVGAVCGGKVGRIFGFQLKNPFVIASAAKQ
jgi:hypothetical protein